MAYTTACTIVQAVIRVRVSMGGASGVAGGSCPLCPMPCPRLPPPVVVRKNYVCPLDPSHSLSLRKVHVKIHKMCQNNA